MANPERAALRDLLECLDAVEYADSPNVWGSSAKLSDAILAAQRILATPEPGGPTNGPLTHELQTMVQDIIGSPGRLPDHEIQRIYRRFREHFWPAPARWEPTDAEVERLAEVAHHEFYARGGFSPTPWHAAAQPNWMDAARAILAALPDHPTADTALRREVRAFAERLQDNPPGHTDQTSGLASRLFAMLDAAPAADEIEMVPTASFPIWIAERDTRTAYINRAEAFAQAGNNPVFSAVLQGPACQLHSTCRDRPDLGLACAAGRANSTQPVATAKDPQAPGDTPYPEVVSVPVELLQEVSDRLGFGTDMGVRIRALPGAENLVPPQSKTHAPELRCRTCSRVMRSDGVDGRCTNCAVARRTE